MIVRPAHQSPTIEIGGKVVGAQEPCFVIAEIGVNHDGSTDQARRLIDVAVAAGCDAVKFQTFRADALASSLAEKASYQAENSGPGSQLEMLRNLELTLDDFGILRDHCLAQGIAFMSTAFDSESLKDVLALEPPCLKWPSGELTNLPFLREATACGLPIILSTGMATLAEVSEAADVLADAGSPFAILQCVSNYPARIEEQNLRTIATMAAAFNRPTGLSDHTIGPWAAIASRALGMCILEKHITLDCTAKGPDHAASAEPADITELVKHLREIEAALGDGVKRPNASEENVRSVARKSLFYASDLPAGHVLSDVDFVSKRPGTGLTPNQASLLVGRPLVRPVNKNVMAGVSDAR